MFSTDIWKMKLPAVDGLPPYGSRLTLEIEKATATDAKIVLDSRLFSMK